LNQAAAAAADSQGLVIRSIDTSARGGNLRDADFAGVLRSRKSVEADFGKAEAEREIGPGSPRINLPVIGTET
jgi:hypothetical protein